MSTGKPLQLLAQDDEDLGVLSAALQDAVAKIGDISYEASAKRLTLIFNRFRWEAGDEVVAAQEAKGERVRCGLQFGCVLGVQARNLRREPKDAVVELLTIAFEPGEAPGGTVTLAFAGGGDLRVEVECIEAALADLSTPWPTPRKPGHGLT